MSAEHNPVYRNPLNLVRIAHLPTQVTFPFISPPPANPIEAKDIEAPDFLNLLNQQNSTQVILNHDKLPSTDILQIITTYCDDSAPQYIIHLSQNDLLTAKLTSIKCITANRLIGSKEVTFQFDDEGKLVKLIRRLNTSQGTVEEVRLYQDQIEKSTYFFKPLSIESQVDNDPLTSLAPLLLKQFCHPEIN